VTQNDYIFFPDTLRFLVCGSVASLAIVETCVGLTSGFIIAMLSEVVFGLSPDQRLRRALVIGAALASIGFAGLVLLRTRVCA
jgi:hypothetical protein